tara:strand:+ start:129 stop:569 length:441 start_codon:yes stop_codon:yes gene_type:complete
MTLEQIRKLNLESPNTLNLEQNLINQLRVETDNLLDVFLKKYKGQFNGPVNSNIIRDSNILRQDVLSMLQEKCALMINLFDKDYNTFINKHGWFENLSAGIRHKVTKDELAYELCEVIRKIYYVYMEDKLPKKYKIDITEKYLLKE